jgi:hypothetical protein
MDAFGEQTLKKDRQCMLLAWLPRPSTERTIVNTPPTKIFGE